MTLPSTGTISFEDINVELGRSPTAPISLNDPEVREMAGKPTGIISLADLRGKSAYITMNVGKKDVYGNIIAGYSDGVFNAAIGSLSSDSLGTNRIRLIGTIDLENNGGGTIILQNIESGKNSIAVTDENGRTYYFYSVPARPEQYDNSGSTVEWSSFIASNVGKSVKIKVAFD